MARRMRSVPLLVLLGACTGGGADRGTRREPLEGDPTLPACGFTVVEPPASPPVDACVDGPPVATIAGPVTLPRTAGPPDEATQAFVVAGSGSFCVRVVNAGVAAAWISIDGAPVLSPGDFDPGVAVVAARPQLGVGSHTLAIRVASTPGTSLTVEVRQAPEPAPADTRIGEQELVAISGLGDAPDPFSPSAAQGLPAETVLAIDATALATPGAPSGQFDFLLHADFEIAGGAYCTPIQTLTVEAAAAAGQTRRLGAAWDGRDGASVLVQQGTYYYRVTVALIRRKRSDGSRETLDTVVSDIQSVTAIDPHGVSAMTTRELTAQTVDIKSRGASYYDLSPVDRACYDASAAARAQRRTQKPAIERFFPVSDLFEGDSP